MPDWRNEAEYDFTDSLKLKEWAWEFLRRNPDYRNIYEEVKELEEMEVSQFGPYPKQHNIQSEHLFYYEPELNTGETAIQWFSRCVRNGIDHHKYSPSVWHARLWGIVGTMPDPNIDRPSIQIFGTKPDPSEDSPFEIIFVRPDILPDTVNWYRLHEYFEGDESDYQQKPNKLVLAFDLSLPLTPQLKAAKNILF